MIYVALAIGLLGVALFFRFAQGKKLQGLQEDLRAMELELARTKLAMDQLAGDKQHMEQKLTAAQEEQMALHMQLSRREAQNEQLIKQQEAQDAQLQERLVQMNLKFENMANAILADKGKQFSEQHKQQLDAVLQPLRERLKDFEQQVQSTHKESLQQQAGLFNELKHLKELNQQMSEEARNLTRALKGENKTQGNWGEVILQRVLERSGLTLNQEYRIQASVRSEDGKRLQPDVTILLPDQKFLVIDSKVSLVDYERYVNAEDPAEQAVALKRHLQSMQNHVRSLSGKSYDRLYGEGSPDFVLMFVPVEPAFIVAVQEDAELFNQAFESQVVIVSTSTLLATLRTIASMWRQENQSRNAIEIARQAGTLYEKFIGFTEDLQKVGVQLELASKAHAGAMNKLVEGKGNLVRKAEQLRDLGARTSRKQDASLLREASGQGDLAEPEA